MKGFLFLLGLLFVLGARSQSCPSCNAVGCGNGVCDFEENCDSCPFDCGICPSCENICGNQLCETTALENSCNCPEDCGICCEDGVCRGLESDANCPADCTATLSGSVYDVETLAVQGNATILCQSHLLTLSSSSSADGTFGFGGVAKGVFTCTATKAGYLPGTQSVWFEPGSVVGANTTVRIPIRQPPARLVGNVRDGFAKTFLRAANVSCLFEGADINKFTDTLGRYFFHDLKPGFFLCTAGHVGFYSQTANVTLSRGVTGTLNFTLSPKPAGIIGKVVDRLSGETLVGANVTCYLARDNSPLAPTLSDASGNFAYNGLLDAEYVCVSTLAGYSRGKARECLEKGVNSTITLVMQQLPATITGNVTDRDTGLAIFGSTVTCANSRRAVTATTVRDGKFVISNVPSATDYICSATAATYYPSSPQPLVVPPGGSVSVYFALAPQPATVHGRVYDSETGTGLGGFSVTCLHRGLGLAFTSATELTNGAYNISGIAAGDVSCTASGTNFISGSVNATLSRGGDHVIDFALAPQKGRLIVTVVDALLNTSVVGASVNCTSTTVTNFTTGSTDGVGVSRFGSLRVGTYTCSVSAATYDIPASQSATVPANGDAVLLFPLTPMPATVTGRVVDATGTSFGLSDASVTCSVTALTTTTFTATTNATGYFTIGSVTVFGSLSCSATRANFLDATSSGYLVVRAGSVHVQIPLPPAPITILVTVVDQLTNTTLAGASTTCASFPGGFFSRTAISNAAGVSTVTGLPRGTYNCTSTLASYSPGTSSVSGTEGQTVTTLNALPPLPGGLAVTVRDAENLNLITGANVTCTGSAGSGFGVTSAGFVNLASLGVGTYTCTADAPPSFLSNSTQATVVKDTVTSLTILLAPRYITISGVVQSVATPGVPSVKIGGVQIVVTNLAPLTANNTPITLTSDTGIFGDVDLGKFSFRSRTPWFYSLDLSDPSDRYFPRLSSFNGSAAADTAIPVEVTQLIAKPATLKGIVRDSANGTLLSGVQIIITPTNSSNPNLTRQLTTDASGFYTINTLGLGSFEVTASKNGYEPSKFPTSILLLLDGDVAWANFSLVVACCGNVEGQVIDSSQEAVLAGVNVTVSAVGGVSFTNVTNVNGTYKFFRVPAGLASITISTPGYVQSGVLNTNIQPQATSVQIQTPIRVALIPVNITGNIGVYNNNTNSWTALDQSNAQVELYFRGTSENGTNVSFLRLDAGTTTYSLPADWRQLFEIKCSDIPQLGAPGSHNYQTIVVQVPPLQALTNIVVNCPMTKINK